MEVKEGQRWVFDKPGNNSFVAEAIDVSTPKYPEWRIIQKLRGGSWYEVGERFVSGISEFWSYLDGQDRPLQ